MKVSAIVGISLLALTFAVWPHRLLAQDGLGPGRRPPQPKICMNDAELEAEAVVRAGIVLRAYARQCARYGIDGSILPKWGAFDAANAASLQNAVRLRNEAYARNYPDDPYAGQRVIDNTLASRGLGRPSPEECLAAADVVGKLKTWNDFLAHARLTELGQVKTQVKACKPKRGAAP